MAYYDQIELLKNSLKGYSEEENKLREAAEAEARKRDEEEARKREEEQKNQPLHGYCLRASV